MLNAVLIPIFAVQGAIIATFTSYVVCYVIRLFDARRYVPFHVSNLRTVVNVVILFLMCNAISHTDVTAADYAQWKGFVPIVLGVELLALTAFNFKPLLATANKILKRRS